MSLMDVSEFITMSDSISMQTYNSMSTFCYKNLSFQNNFPSELFSPSCMIQNPNQTFPALACSSWIYESLISHNRWTIKKGHLEAGGGQ